MSVRGVAGLIAVLALAGPGAPQTRVAYVGRRSALGDIPAALQHVLGADFDVKGFEGASGAGLAKFAPAVVVFVNDSDPVGSGGNLDAFEPKLRNRLARYGALPSRPRVYLWLSDGKSGNGASGGVDSEYADVLLPLALQAAREAGATAIQHPPLLGPLTTADSSAARDVAEGVAEVIAPATLKAGWRIVRASSFQADEGPPKNAIDGDPDTYWHSEYDPVEAKPPHELVLDLGRSEWLVAFKYLPRQDGGVNGDVKAYEIYVSESPTSQTTLAAKGLFGPGNGQKIARFKTPVKGRYVRFVCLSEQTGGPYASAAEIDVVRDPDRN